MLENVREALDALIRQRGEDYSAISRLLGRNPAYIQQFIKRGTPRRLAEEDRLRLAAYFRVPEQQLGGQSSQAATPELVAVPRVEIDASAGPGALADVEAQGAPIAFDPVMLRGLGVKRTAALSIIRVAGGSMEPTLLDGDDILVDGDAVAPRSGGIYVLRLDGLLMVKRLILDRRGAWPIIRSDSDAYPDITGYDPALLSVIGRVIWCGRRMG